MSVKTSPTSFKTSPTSFSFLYAVLLFGIAVSVGILHQAVIQNLRLHVKRYKADFEWSQSRLEHASRERNAARQRVKDVGVDLEDSYSHVKQYKGADFELLQSQFHIISQERDAARNQSRADNN